MLPQNEVGPSQRGDATEARKRNFLIQPAKNTSVPHLRVVRSGDDHAAVSKEARTYRTRYFLLIDAARDKRLSRADCAVLAAILDHVNRATGQCYPSLATIAKSAKVSTRSAPRSIVKLCECGYLIRVSGSRARSNTYRWECARPPAVTDELDTDELVSTDRPGTDSEPQKLLTSSSPKPVTSNQQEERTRAPQSERALPRVGTAERFVEFWSAYPRKEGAKEKAKATWRKKHLDTVADQILAHVRARAAGDPQWVKDGGQFIPYATTFLNGEYWTNEWQASAPHHRGTDSPTRVAPSTLSIEEADLANARALARLNPEQRIGGAP